MDIRKAFGLFFEKRDSRCGGAGIGFVEGHRLGLAGPRDACFISCSDCRFCFFDRDQRRRDGSRECRAGSPMVTGYFSTCHAVRVCLGSFGSLVHSATRLSYGGVDFAFPSTRFSIENEKSTFRNFKMEMTPVDRQSKFKVRDGSSSYSDFKIFSRHN